MNDENPVCINRPGFCIFGCIKASDEQRARRDKKFAPQQKRGTLRDERLFATWLTRILIRECVNIQRRQRRTVPVDTLPEQAQEDENDAVRSLREAMETLPQRQRTMVVLHYMEDYDVREVARIMGTTRGAVCAGLSRARETLRRRIGEDIV